MARRSVATQYAKNAASYLAVCLIRVQSSVSIRHSVPPNSDSGASRDVGSHFKRNAAAENTAAGAR